jgi:hypothetical protein
MLARIVSDTWQEDPTKPVFIDRNGSTFDLVLDYLRYGSITLPMTVSKDKFLRDMNFYGIVHTEGTVKTSSEAWVAQVDNRLNAIKTLVAEKTHVELVNDIDLLANHCADQYLLGGRRVWLGYTHDNATGKKLYGAASSSLRVYKYKEIFLNSLSKFGLRFVGVIEGNSSNGITIPLMSM